METSVQVTSRPEPEKGVYVMITIFGDLEKMTNFFTNNVKIFLHQ
jgi:hypothetical protein